MPLSLFFCDEAMAHINKIPICRLLFPAAFLFLIFLLPGCAKKNEIPNSGTALDQFYYAMENFYFPAENAVKEKEKKELARQAAEALEAVWIYFPPEGPSLVHMEARYYQGRSFQAIGENKKAVESYYASFMTDVPSEAINDYEADMISYKNEAWYALMGLRKDIPGDYFRDIDNYRPSE